MEFKNAFKMGVERGVVGLMRCYAISLSQGEGIEFDKGEGIELFQNSSL